MTSETNGASGTTDSRVGRRELLGGAAVVAGGAVLGTIAVRTVREPTTYASFAGEGLSSRTVSLEADARIVAEAEITDSWYRNQSVHVRVERGDTGRPLLDAVETDAVSASATVPADGTYEFVVEVPDSGDYEATLRGPEPGLL